MDRSIRYFTLTQKILSLSGLWHTQPQRERLIRYCVIGFILLCALFGQMCQLLTSNVDLRFAVGLLQVFILTMCGASMYCHCVLHFKAIRKIYNYILNDWQLLRDDTELKILQKHAHYGNLFTFACLVMFIFYLIMTISPSVQRIVLYTNEIRSDLDLYPIISCFDYFSSRKTYYYPILIYQIITLHLLIMVSIASYSVYVLFIQHACALLSIIIRYKICSPFVHEDHNDDVPVTPTDLSPWIIDIVQRLARTTKFMSLVNSAFEKNYLFQIFLGFLLLILDFLCIPVLLESNTSMMDSLWLIFYISGNLSIIYINCYIGQKLTDCSTDVYREACLIPFHKISLKTQKLLLTTLTICSKPYAISIGKVYVASHEFFSNLLRSSMSFAMVVHSLQAI